MIQMGPVMPENHSCDWRVGTLSFEIASLDPRQERLLEIEFNLGTNDTISHGYTMGTLIKTADTKAQVSVLGWQYMYSSHIQGGVGNRVPIIPWGRRNVISFMFGTLPDLTQCKPLN